jgi:tRNA(adenine34) deaminase
MKKAVSVNLPGKSRLMTETDEFFMGFALREAQKAREADEVPIGAVVVIDNQIAGVGFNQPIGQCDPTAHAEIQALRAAASCAGNYRLTRATLYVTVEPCAMCSGAMIHARIQRLVYGTAEPRTGAVNSVFRICTSKELNHQVYITAGVREKECRELMQAFFRTRRKLPSEKRS